MASREQSVQGIGGGNIVFTDGTEKSFTKQRSGFVARLTGFYVEKGKELYESQGESYVLPYLR